MAPLISREEWIRRFGDQHGAARHRQPSLEEQFNAGERLGSGAYGTVHRSNYDPSVAIKEQLESVLPSVGFEGAKDTMTRRAEKEANILAYLGNELGISPAVRAFEANRGAGPASYLAMDNLADKGYITLKEAEMSTGGDRVEISKLRAEQAILEAWAARAGVAAHDTHSGNVMVLPPGQPAAEDGSRVKLIDVGLYQQGLNPEERLVEQAYKIADAYDALGLDSMGQEFKYLAKDLLERGEIKTAENLMDDALSDVEARREALTQAQYARNEQASKAMRFAGDSLQSLMQKGLLANTIPGRRDLKLSSFDPFGHGSIPF